MKHSTIEELKEKERMLRAKLVDVRNAISEHEEQVIIPELEAKYNGKWFKTHNCYSCPKTDSDYWWTYSRVDDITSGSHCHVTQFQIDKYKEFTVRTECVPIELIKSYTEITEQEAMDEFGKELEVVMMAMIAVAE